jgi:hypothetical protein
MAQCCILSEEEKWRDLVGGFILAFGDIELFTHHLWQAHCPGVNAPQNFRRRTKGLLKALQRDAQKHWSLINSLRDRKGTRQVFHGGCLPRKRVGVAH